MNETPQYVRSVLSDKGSYMINGNASNEVKAQFEYKEVKSPAEEKLNLLKKGIIRVPRWLVVIGVLFAVLFLGIMIAAVILALNPLRKAVYNESCEYTECSADLKLKCINNVCQCYSDENYTDKCVRLSTYSESCFVASNCFQIYNLVCKLGRCTCESNNYWNGTICVSRYTYSQSCVGDQCLPDRNLACLSNICDCPNTNKYICFKIIFYF